MDDELRALLAAQQALIEEMRAELRAQRPPQPPSVTVSEINARYASANDKRHAWAAIAFRLRGPVKALGARQVMSLKPRDWNDYRATRPDLAVSTLNQELSWLKAAINHAVREGVIPFNPLATARKVKLPKKHNETAPDESDVAKLLADANPILRVIVLCAADAGMRNGEINRLSWPWLDREAMTIRLPNAVCKNKRGGAVPMTRRMLEAIDAIPRTLRSPYVLVNPLTGRPYSPKTFCVWMRELADGAGIQAAPGETVTLHSLRHGFATNAVRRNVRIEIVSEVLRHASVDQTKGYVQTSGVDLRAARDAFEAGIKRDLSKP